MDKVLCGNCRNELDESRSLPVKDRKPCPSCGSLNRSYCVHLEAEAKVYSRLRMKGKSANPGKPFIETIQGFDFYRKTKKWMKLLRIIDKRNNAYKEIIIDPETEEIVHKCEEPLSEHQGYGTAKKQETRP